ncbi:MAG: hypothetical protein K0S33_1948 [Bacteroidetes bacterium]|jgi:hypothetical protein|nr:hypothetical protein [Bacteroidota bacterium]
MFKKIRAHRRKIAVKFLLVLLLNLLYPLEGYSLTSGPSQPEFSSFSAVESSDMVDVSTGDFNYNLPLLTVPGPNGGYPINLNYNAGITTEQEASWVGLGWNLNVGEISRTVRGIPDDFNGDGIEKQTHQKDNVTVGLSWKFGKTPPIPGGTEVVGKNMSIGQSISIFFNNYRGVGLGYGLGLQRIADESGAGELLPSVHLGYDSESGVGLSGGISYTKVTNGDQPGKAKRHFYSLNMDYTSRSGIRKLGFGYANTSVGQESKGEGSARITKYTGNAQPDPGVGIGINFASSYVPSVPYSMTGKSLYGSLKLGTLLAPGVTKTVDIGVNFSTQHVDDKLKTHKGYGYLHFAQMDNSDAIMDFNREKEFPVTHDAPAIPLPVNTYDVLSVKGQGISGVFRPFRSDIGFYRSPSVTNSNNSTTLGGDAAAPAVAKGGFDFGDGANHSYSGMWTDSYNDLKDDYSYETDDFYFKMAGELNASSSEEARYAGRDEKSFLIKSKMKIDGILDITSFEPEVFNKISNSTASFLGSANRSTKDTRTSNIEYFTRSNMTGLPGYSNRPEHLLNVNEYPGTTGSPGQIDYSNMPDHIAMYRIRNVNGMVYEYGLPAYNNEEKDVMFTTGSIPDFKSNTVAYADTDASISNDKGDDHFFSSSKTLAYAHSYLITAVYSSDYIDLTDDGPTEDDFGYWVKFNYSKLDDPYYWRSPYYDAHAAFGYYSNKKDDKGTYSYGAKDIWYVNSIETKTHIAEFHLSNREDGKGASGEHATASLGLGTTLKKLDKIKLFNKSDRITPIKTVHFHYNYSLCKGVYNTSLTGQGKLTLEKVWFTYRDNDKGEFSPYRFVYPVNPADGNYNYDPMAADRWGYYMPIRRNTQPPGTPRWILNEEWSYVDQQPASRPDVDKYAAAWSLKKIILPSGGEINITYEADDYAYVQDKRAMQMCRIVETGGFESGAYVYKSGALTKGKKEMERIYFDLNEDVPVANVAEIKKYLEGVGTQDNPMYFKAYMNLKKGAVGEGMQRDYVSGYCEFEQDEIGVDELCKNGAGTLYERAYVDVRSVPKRQREHSKGETHPFTKAAWEYLKMERNDLTSPDPGDAPTDIGKVATFAVNIFNDIKNIFGFYNNADLSNWGNSIYLESHGIEEYRPSFIRLNNPNYKKAGGGLRVKKITSTDNWTASGTSASEYTTSYDYTMPDGKSSGVAEYEPLTGGDEIPHRLPSDRYGERTFLFNNKNLYVEEPFGEAYFPGANVAYRRVIVRSENGGTGDTKTNKKTAAGQTMYEFYSAKEFPVKVQYTKPDPALYNPPAIIVPFFGTENYANNGYSQGYSIRLNDMHGKLKAVSTYPAMADLNNPLEQPKTKIEYRYNVAGTYNPDGENSLNNTVTVLTGDGEYTPAEMGIKTDFALDLNENSSYSYFIGEETNLDVPLPLTFLPSYWPAFSHSESMYRAVSNVKVVQQQGILMSTKTYGEGSVSTHTNLMFDALTGAPLLTTVNNNFDKPVYTYNMPAHWYYKGMGPSYVNYRTSGNGTLLTVITTGGIVDISSLPTGSYNPGDKLLTTSSTYYWVNTVSGGNMSLITENGTPAPSGPTSFWVVESGRKNLLAVNAGTIVSLSNPLMGGSGSGILEAFNTLLEGGTGSDVFSFTNCDGTEIDMIIAYNYVGGAGITSVTMSTASGNYEDNCKTFTINLSTAMSSASELTNYRFHLIGSTLIAEHISNPALNFTCTYVDDMNCGVKCLDDVLQAFATGFSDRWIYPYNDVQAPAIGATPYATAAAANPWRYGQWGVWRPSETYAYLTDRKQKRDITGSPTNLAKDGVFEKFMPFNWAENVNLASLNPEWTKAVTMTKYSPYGFELENRDAIDVFSSALYGYKNALAVAAAANAKYYEIAFDGFEDYAGTYTPSSPHGHIAMNAGSLSDESHTGLKSLAISYVTAGFSSESFADADAYVADNYLAGTLNEFTPLEETHKYTVCAWFKPQNAADKPEITIAGAGVSSPGTPVVAKNPIEGWIRVECTFELNYGSTGAVDITFAVKDQYGAPRNGYLDDVRIQPFNSSMETFVYDPVKLWTTATLDNRNYATFYNYDEEGNLVQVKKETERGIMTIQQGRKNIKQIP